MDKQDLLEEREGELDAGIAALKKQCEELEGARDLFEHRLVSVTSWLADNEKAAKAEEMGERAYNIAKANCVSRVVYALAYLCLLFRRCPLI